MGRDRLPFMYFSEILVLLVKKTINVCSISSQPHFTFNVIITFSCNYFFSCCFWCSFETRSHAPQAGLSLIGNQGWPLAPPASVFQVLYCWATSPALTKQFILPFPSSFLFSPFLLFFSFLVSLPPSFPPPKVQTHSSTHAQQDVCHWTPCNPSSPPSYPRTISFNDAHPAHTLLIALKMKPWAMRIPGKLSGRRDWW